MLKKRVIIELAPSRFEVAVLEPSGRAKPLLAQRLHNPDWSENWERVLHELQAPLAELVSSSDLHRAAATLLHQSPTAVSGIFSCPASVGTGAEKAAHLALRDASGFDLDQHACALHRVGADRSAADDAQRPRQVHTLGIADSEPTTSALASWLEQAGLTPAGIIPIEAAAIMPAVEEVLRTDEQQVRIVICCGEHISALAACAGGRLRFVRQIAIGTEVFVDALAREITPAPGGQPISLSRERAREIVFASGIPTRAEVVDPATGLTSEATRPLLQPLVQRYLLEIRQSLRFGLSEEERADAVLTMVGPGSRLPRLANVLAEQCQLNIAPGEPSPPLPADFQSSEHGAIAMWTGLSSRPPGLLPPRLESARTMHCFRRAMWTGIAAAGVLIAAEGVLLRMELAQQRHDVATLQARLSTGGRAQELNAELLSVRSGIADARQRIKDGFPATPPWEGVLAMLSTHTPPEIRIAEIKFAFDAGGSWCRINGYALDSAGGERGAALQAYMDALVETPVVRSCRLDSTRRGESEQGPIQNFEITLSLVDLPLQAFWNPTHIADAGGEP